MNCELPDVQAGFRKGRGTRDQIANNRWIMEKARKFQKNIYFCFINYAKAFDYVDHNKLWKILKEMRIPEWLVFPFSRGTSQPRSWTQVSCLACWFFTSWATKEAHKLNKQGDKILPFPICNQSVVPCPVLTVAPDLHTNFSRGSSGGLAFPSL